MSLGPAGEAEDQNPGRPASPTPPAREWKVWHALAAFGAGLVGSLAATAAVAPGGLTSFEYFAVVGPAQALCSLGTVAVLRCRPLPGRAPLGLRFRAADAWGIPAGAGLEVALSLLLSLVVAVFFRGEAPVQEVVQVVDEAAGLGTRAAVVITAVLLGPLAEEVVFRGVLLRALARHLPDWGVVSASAGLFALGHLVDPNAALAVPAFFLMGLVLGRLVLKTGRLGPAVATHAGFNLLSVLLLFFA